MENLVPPYSIVVLPVLTILSVSGRAFQIALPQGESIIKAVVLIWVVVKQLLVVCMRVEPVE